MSSLTNINNNTRVVNVGRTTPVAPGQQPASKSIPVVLASDQTAIPVVEQNKVQSEVSLSLLGIPRSEVALGIFADVNTYDVNPSEWSSSPQYYNKDFGIKHLPNEAGALVEAPRDNNAVLTSKRFFRYQPGRVSAATFGVKCTVSNAHFAQNPVIRKYGIFDNFDGYYWETKQSGEGDNFNVVRRTQSMLKFPASPFGLTTENLRKSSANTGDTPIPYNQTDDYRIVGKEGREIKGKYFVRDRQIITDKIQEIAVGAFQDLLSANTNGFNTYYTGLGNGSYAQYTFKQKCHRDVTFALNMALMDMEWGGDAHTRINTRNYQTGLFPAYSGNQPAQFELDLHTAVRTRLDALSDLTTAGETKVLALYDFLVKVDNSTNTDGFFNRIVAGDDKLAASQAITGSSGGAGNLAILSYGDKEKIDTLLDTRKHYYSYFVSSFQFDENAVANTDVKQTYTFTVNSINADFMPAGDFSNLEGTELSDDSTAAAYYPYTSSMSVTNGAGATVALGDSQALALNEFYLNIKYKCVRDLEYVINGYKNDLVGGGNAETLYNASMYYRGSGLSIFSQNETSGLPDEIAKHDHLRDWIKTDLADTTIPGMGSAQSSNSSRIDDLAGIIIANFTTETQTGVNLGDRGYAGNLVTFRDGLLMIHGAINDPKMLKDKEQIKTTVSQPFDETQPTIFKISKGSVTFGQTIRVLGPTGQTNLSDANTGIAGVTTEPALYGKLYKVSRVYGPTGSEFSLKQISDDANTHNQDVYAYRSQSLVTDDIHVETVVPFIGDRIYDENFYRQPNADRLLIKDKTITVYEGTNDSIVYTENDDPFPVGMQWPYRYSSSGQLGDQTGRFIGHIDTSLSPNDSTQISKIRQQYDDINFNPEYINWIKNNVKPEFWGVYEYRVPRSRFSHDKLDGKTSKRVYSDLATGPTGIVRPGQEVTDEAGLWQDAISEYNFDFTKVTMLKIEFSWYGAVGALFLAYVPVGNGEARWVRVHHLRASNQLKIASLGNATLPITYNVWGGGSTDTLGDGETKTHTYGTSQSHHIVKYGASYYIDGGDRGTVRLYSHNNNDVVKAFGKKWVDSTSGANGGGVDADGHIAVSGTTAAGGTAYPDLVYFMGAQVKTNNPIDTGIKVVWVDYSVTPNELYLSKQPAGSGLTLIPDRGDLVYGLETKDLIYSTVEGNPVRNRVQVYPTKMSTANLGSNPVRLRMKRTPIFQTLTQTGANVTLAINGEYTVTPNNTALTVTEAGGAAGVTYLQNGEEIYGWFQGTINDVDAETIFGRLYKKTNEYYFEVLQSFNGIVKLNDGGLFLKDLRFARAVAADGTLSVQTVDTVTETALADQLTSVKALNNTVVPIPNTGSNVATLYLQPTGTEQVNLDTYFDYNKEYLSYPLTDQAETLYFAVDSDQNVNVTAEVAIGLTWEEQ